MSHIKVLHMITHLGVGGALDNTLLTVKGLSRDRYEVHLAAGDLAPGEGYTDWEDRSRECSDALFIFPNLRRPIDLLRDTQVLRQITAFMRDENYDIVHTHCAKAGVLGRIAAHRAGVPVVVHTFHAFGWQVAHAFHSSGWHNSKAAVKKQLYCWVERYTASLSNALITVADMNKQEALSLNIAPLEKLTTIYSGIDLEYFSNFSVERSKLCHKLGLDPELRIVGMIGRLSVQKAPLDFVEAAKMIIQKKANVQFVIAGDGPLASEVKKAIVSEQRIRLLGFRSDIREVLGILDVFALSSLWEGMGRALTEAMSVGLPIAATSVGGVPELVEHGETGLLSPPKNPVELADNILWLLDHPAEALKMGKVARDRVVPAFGVERMVERIEDLYERLMLNKAETVFELTGHA